MIHQTTHHENILSVAIQQEQNRVIGIHVYLESLFCGNIFGNLETDPQGTSFAVIMLLALQDLVHAPWPNGKDRLSCYADHTLSQKGRYSFLTLADQSTEPGIYPDGGRRTEHLSSKLHNHNASRVRMNRTSQSSTTGFRVFHKFPARIY